MTGAYLRVKRDGKYRPVEIEHLTDEERAEKFPNANGEGVLMWLNHVCKTLVEAERVLDELIERGILTRDW